MAGHQSRVSDFTDIVRCRSVVDAAAGGNVGRPAQGGAGCRRSHRDQTQIRAAAILGRYRRGGVEEVVDVSGKGWRRALRVVVITGERPKISDCESLRKRADELVTGAVS